MPKKHNKIGVGNNQKKITMKKTIMFMAILALIITSCKKERVCEQTSTSNQSDIRLTL